MHYRLKIYFYVVIIANFCEISAINIYSNAFEKIKKKRSNQRELCPVHDPVCYFTVTIKIHTYISITKASYFAGRHRNCGLEKSTSWFHIIILLPQDGTKRLKISAFQRFPSEKNEQILQGIAQEMSSTFDFLFG